MWKEKVQKYGYHKKRIAFTNEHLKEFSGRVADTF